MLMSVSDFKKISCVNLYINILTDLSQNKQNDDLTNVEFKTTCY